LRIFGAIRKKKKKFSCERRKFYDWIQEFIRKRDMLLVILPNRLSLCCPVCLRLLLLGIVEVFLMPSRFCCLCGQGNHIARAAYGESRPHHAPAYQSESLPGKPRCGWNHNRIIGLAERIGNLTKPVDFFYW
jgi:hypothetical protein